MHKTDFKKLEQAYRAKYGILSNILPEIIAVRFGLKTATTINAQNSTEFERFYRKAVNFCLKSGLHAGYYKEKRGKYRIIISREKLNLKNGDLMVHQNRGNWFSYPKCCIKNYSKHGGGYYFVNCVRDLFMKKSVFDFRMNPFLVATPFHLFVHLPCSLECKKTFDYTKKLLGIIKQKNNRLYKDIVRLNRAPVFYTDILGRGILFEGKIKSNKINYKNFYFDKSGLKEQSKYNKEGDILLLSSIFGALSQGDSLVLEDGVLSIKKGDSLIKSFENSKHLLWKIINFI